MPYLVRILQFLVSDFYNSDALVCVFVQLSKIWFSFEVLELEFCTTHFHLSRT